MSLVWSPSISFGALFLGCAIAASSGCDIVTLTGDLSQPFEGPGFSLDTGLLAAVPESGTFVLSGTVLVIGDGSDSKERFDKHVAAISAALPTAPGLVGFSLRTNLLGDPTNRTMTVWESEDALWNFILSESHLAAMEDVGQIAAAGTKVVSYPIRADELPPRWDDVIARTDRDGFGAR
jgi:heme-degrading monooxygenase HmoA